jgi:hypothetical protein
MQAGVEEARACVSSDRRTVKPASYSDSASGELPQPRCSTRLEGRSSGCERAAREVRGEKTAATRRALRARATRNACGSARVRRTQLLRTRAQRCGQPLGGAAAADGCAAVRRCGADGGSMRACAAANAGHPLINPRRARARRGCAACARAPCGSRAQLKRADEARHDRQRCQRHASLSCPRVHAPAAAPPAPRSPGTSRTACCSCPHSARPKTPYRHTRSQPARGMTDDDTGA